VRSPLLWPDVSSLARRSLAHGKTCMMQVLARHATASTEAPLDVATARAVDRLRAAGLRVTVPRLAVLAEVAERPHADVGVIAAGVRTRIGSLSTQAAYDIVYALAQAGILRQIQPAGSAARFEVETGDNHHHVVCRACGEIADVPCAVGEAPCLEAGDSGDYLIDEAEVTYWGLCSSCLDAAATDRSTGPITNS
jgi:Fur family ferric uptake transcriptional regulator